MSVLDFVILCVLAFFFFVGMIGIFVDAVGGNESEVKVPEIKIRDEYAEENPKAPRMDFDVFEELYILTPNKWNLWWDHVTYNGKNHNHTDVYFTNSAELKKYNEYVKLLNERRNEEIRDKRTLELLKQIQSDIDDYRTSAIEEMKKHLGEEFLSHDQT